MLLCGLLVAAVVLLFLVAMLVLSLHVEMETTVLSCFHC